MKKLLIATTNKGKLNEFSKLLSDLPVELVSLSDVGIDTDVEEDGLTYEENSQKKALFYSKLSGLPAIADDGGIEIAALNNEPGVRSRRWLGYEASDKELIDHLQKISEELPDDNRAACFKTVVTFVTPDGEVFSQEGSVKGEIAKKPLSNMIIGYPYRSFFFLPEIGKFYHEEELSIDEEKIYNHRLRALKKITPKLRQFFKS